MNLPKASCLTATLLLAASLLVPAHAASSRGGWDGNGVSIHGMAQGAASATGPAKVQSVELPSSPVQGATTH